MASEELLEPATPESPEDKPENPETPESPEDELTPEEIKQLKAERDQYKRDYAALKQDYDKNANKANKSKSDRKDEPDDDLTDWKIMNADAIRMAGKEYQEELAFFKSQGVKVTTDVLERALTNAKAKKGLGSTDSGEAQRQTETTTVVQGENRRSKPKLPQLTEQQKKLGLTPEQIAEYDARMAEERKALGLK